MRSFTSVVSPARGALGLALVVAAAACNPHGPPGDPRPGTPGDRVPGDRMPVDPVPGGRVLDENIVARCRMAGALTPAVFSAREPFSVVVRDGGRNVWVGTAKNGTIQVPFDGIGAGGRPLEVLVVSGPASMNDRVAALDGRALDRTIADRHHADLIASASAGGKTRRLGPGGQCVPGPADDCNPPRCVPFSMLPDDSDVPGSPGTPDPHAGEEPDLHPIDAGVDARVRPPVGR